MSSLVKRVQTKSSSSRPSDVVFESTSDMFPKDVIPLPLDTFELKDSVPAIEEESVIKPCTESGSNNQSVLGTNFDV